MKTGDSMTSKVEEYLHYRRCLGYALRIEGGMLLNFARYADQCGHRGTLSCELMTRWARLPVHADRLYWARRIEVLIGFARYCQLFDPRNEIPPRYIFGPAHRRTAPYIYTASQLKLLVREANQMPSKDSIGTNSTLLGLLACTGLRISEALGLEIGDVNLQQGTLIIRESKRRKWRLVPLHSSALAPLRKYANRRMQRFPGASHFFVNHSGHRLPYSTIRTVFRGLTRQLGMLKEGKRPRLHDLRHTFACRVLLNWSRRTDGHENRIDWLSHYMGHERVSDTYWYLSATPQLFAIAAARFESHTQHLSSQ